MNKPWTPKRATVELRPSRIRRDPPPPAPVAKPSALNAYPTERETWTVIIGVLMFAIAITIIIIGFSDYTA